MATEMRLIDANKLKDRFKLRIDWLGRDVHDEYSRGLFHGAETDMELIDEMPTVEAVEVVRCEHCIHSLSDGWICGGPSFTMPSHPTYPNEFCSYGERRTNNER